jgi:hypothetical protein
MPLVAATLESSLADLFDAPPATVAGCAQAWADALVDYAGAIIPASTTVATAGATLTGALVAAFSGTTAPAAMETAFAAFAVTVGGGMAGYVATPPPSPVGFALQLATNASTKAAAAASWASLIDTWLRTGSATPLPSGPPILWS